MFRKIKAYVLKQQFAPGMLGVWLNPFYFARKGLYEEVARLAPRMHGQLLDIGCGTKPYQSLFSAAECYIGLELDTPGNRVAKRADYFYDGNVFPFDVGKFDGVVCNQVLEHIFNPDRFLQELSRVLKPGGELLLTVPFVWDEHEQPWDYARYSSYGLRDLLERNGFSVLEQRKTNADARVLFQLVNAYLYKILHTPSPKLNLVICMIVMAPVNLLGIMLSAILPSNADLYLDQVVFSRKSVE